jgi:hypothetical protein
MPSRKINAAMGRVRDAFGTVRGSERAKDDRDAFGSLAAHKRRKKPWNPARVKRSPTDSVTKVGVFNESPPTADRK